jgi:hypothetical protein
MSGISYNVWLCGLCAGVSWFRPLCFPAELSKFIFSKAITNSTIQRQMTVSYRVRKRKYMEGSGRGLTQDICRPSVRVLGSAAETRMLCIPNKAWMVAST